MTSVRQVETNSVHQSNYHTGYIRTSAESSWEVVAHNNNNSDDPGITDTDSDVVPCTYLDLATHINLQGSEQRMKAGFPIRNSIRWNKEVNFHESLRLPAGGSSGAAATDGSEKGIAVIFEAMASEGVAVALSPQPAFQRGATLEITFGAVGNTKTTIQRKHSNPSVPVSEVSVPCRVCKEGTWSSFWVCVWKGKTYVGVGKLPGQQCLAFLDAGSSDNGKTNGNGETPAQEDVSNSDGMDDAAEEKPEADAAAGNMPGTIISELLYVGLGNAAQQRRPVKIRNLHVTSIPSVVAQELENTTEASTMDVLMGQQEDVDDAALKEYQEQCRKAKARAEKFGIEYKEPTLASVVPWSQARKLRANPQKGFATGLDVTDAAELTKQEARKARFGAVPVPKKRELEDGGDGIKTEEGADGENKEGSTDMTDTTIQESLPIAQAWDNEELVRFQRLDPPTQLWTIPQDGEEDAGTTDEFSMETDKPTYVPEKIHIFSIDWSAFKQIRSVDLMAHFTIYGPSYVEWLGDLGCNILFEDKFSAGRALQAMTQELPSPPPSELNDGDDEYVPPDFGAMGWRLGRTLVTKVKNDRFGRRGTKSRLIMRPANSLDILEERPSSWPNPPPGFSTRRILGPGDDYNTNVMDDDDDDGDYNRNDNDGHRNKRRRRNSNDDRNSNDYNNNRNKMGNATGKRRERGSDSRPSAEDMMSKGLAGGRAGFSVEEMEAMRAAKKNAK